MTQIETHTVVPGDTLSDIAMKYYGDGTHESWERIYEANKAVIGPDPNVLMPGQILTIPPKEEHEQPEPHHNR